MSRDWVWKGYDFGIGGVIAGIIGLDEIDWILRGSLGHFGRIKTDA